MSWLLGIAAAIKGAREWLVLVLVGAAGAWLYVQYRETARDLDRHVQWSEVACAAAGVPYAASVAAAPDGKRLTHPAGRLCQQRVAELARFKAETDAGTARILADQMSSELGKQNADARAAASAADRARLAAERMEEAEREAEARNRVDREWFDALNDVAGLRPPGAPPAR